MLENAVESKGGLAFKVDFKDSTPVENEKVKVLQDRANKEQRKSNSNADIKRKILEADIRRQKQQLETIVKLKETNEKVEKVAEIKGQSDEQKRQELKKAQEAHMDKAKTRRDEHLANLKLRANKMARAVKRSNSNENQDGSPAKKAC